MCLGLSPQRYKKLHGLAFQGIGAPNGLIIDAYGPVPGHNNDLHVLNVSNALARLQTLFTAANGIRTAMGAAVRRFRCYGDSIYPPSAVISRRRRMPPLSAAHLAQNSRVNASRTSIEWTFGKVNHLWRHIDLPRQMKLQHCPIGVGKLFTCGHILTNLHTTLYGSQTGLYFQVAPPTLEDYLSGISTPQQEPLVDLDW